MAQFKELELSGGFFEPIASSEEMIVPIMKNYPSPSNTFDIYSNNEGGGEGGVEGGFDVNQAIEIGGQVLGSLLQNQDGTKKELRQVCGRRPLLRRNRGDYDACRERFYRELQGIGGSDKGISNEQLLELMRQRDANSKKGKIGTPAVVGIVLGALAVGTAIFLIARKK
jgi:hypothetical protein